MQNDRAEARRRVQWFHPGEVVLVARVPQDLATSRDLHAEVHAVLGDRAGRLLTDHAQTRSIVFSAPEQPALVFVFRKLGEAESPRAVKDAVEALHQDVGGSTRPARNGIQLIGALPHIHVRAHEGHSGASPGSLPRPVYPDQVPPGWDYRFYQPVNPTFDVARPAAEAEPMRVAVLDVVPDLAEAQRRAATLRNEWLGRLAQHLANHSPGDARYAQETAQLETHHASAIGDRLGSEPPPYPVPDHGLFVSGLIHGVAPRARLSLEPVLNEMGTGDLSLLLLGLQRVIEGKADPRTPQVINLSLGFLPHPARVPAAWYGLQRPHDPGYLYSDALAPAADNPRHWIAANRARVGETVDLLEAGLRELGRYLTLNNCLVIAAAGNDSVHQVEARQPRLEPRLPARFDTVLGVAATTSNPRQPARYSNVGDERELGDHVATFGGNASDTFEPEDGVIGVYAGDFPEKRPNETGWAFWSGTSFATGIVSGVAANYWAAHPELDAATVLADIHGEASAFGPYVAALRTPSIEVRGRWGRVGS